MIVFANRGAESLGICHLSAMLKANNIETRLAFEPSLFDDTKYLHYPSIPRILNYNKKFANYILKMKPKVLAFSVLTMNYLWALDIARRVKAHSDVVTVFGGIHVQAMPEAVLKNPEADYILRGEGEYTFLKLVQSLLEGNPDHSIDGLGYKDQGELKLNQVGPTITDLDALPFADREIFAPYEDYQSMIFMCGRGCPMRCTFCDSPMQKEHFPDSKNYLRYRSVDRCFEEMKILRTRYNVQNFNIVDDVFTVNKTWMQEFCSRYPVEIGLPFQVAGYPTTLSEEKIIMLKEAGCAFLQMGIQSLNQDNRRNILDRRETNEDIANCIDWSRKHDLNLSTDYIFFPWEKSEEDQLKAAHFFHEHPPDRLANFYLSYLPGTPLVGWAKKNGYLSEENIQDIEIGTNAYYHAGGEFINQPKNLNFFNNFYNFFILLLITPKQFGKFLFKIHAYKFTRFIPKTSLLIFKEYILPLFTKRQKVSPALVKYGKYYLLHYKSFIFGRYS